MNCEPGELVITQSPRVRWQLRSSVRVHHWAPAEIMGRPPQRLEFVGYPEHPHIKDMVPGIAVACLRDGPSAFDAVMVVFPTAVGWVWDDSIEAVK